MIERRVVVARRLMEVAGIQHDFATVGHIVVLDSVALVNRVHVHYGVGRSAVTPMKRRGPLSRIVRLVIRELVEFRCRVEIPAESVDPGPGENTEETALVVVEI